MGWFLHLLTWDGLLPGFVWGVPHLTEHVFPGNAGVGEVVGTVLPIGAFLVRLGVGARQISGMGGSGLVRFGRLAALFCGLVFLVLIDLLMILSVQMGLRLWDEGGLTVFASLYGIYLAFMMVAWIPNPRREADTESDESEVSPDAVRRTHR